MKGGKLCPFFSLSLPLSFAPSLFLSLSLSFSSPVTQFQFISFRHKNFTQVKRIQINENHK